MYSPGDIINISENLSIETKELLYIERSTQPIVRFDLKIQDTTVTYISASYTEADNKISVENSDYLWYGTHGPLYKKDSSCKTKADCKIFCSSGASDYVSNENTAFEPFKIKIKKEGK